MLVPQLFQKLHASGTREVESQSGSQKRSEQKNLQLFDYVP